MSGKENINIALKEIGEEFRASVSVDCVIFGYDKNELKVLLIESEIAPYIGKYALLGDLVRPDESLDEATSRVLHERTGVSDFYLEQVHSFGKVDRHPLGRVITVAFYSLVEIDKVVFRDVDKKKLKWSRIEEATDLAFDHDIILKYCRERLRQRMRERPIGFNLLPKKFTLMQLQSLYEVILDTSLDKRNFRRKLKSLNLLIELEEQQEDVAHRPATFYRFDFDSYNTRLHKERLRFEL